MQGLDGPDVDPILKFTGSTIVTTALFDDLPYECYTIASAGILTTEMHSRHCVDRLASHHCLFLGCPVKAAVDMPPLSVKAVQQYQTRSGKREGWGRRGTTH
jgi:hypothetical protein